MNASTEGVLKQIKTDSFYDEKVKMYQSTGQWYKQASAFDENPVPVVIMPNTDEFYQHGEDKVK